MSLEDVKGNVRHYGGDEVWVDLFYPRMVNSKVRAVRVGLTDTRAADDILITYDFDRDGWVIKHPGKEIREGDGPEWVEAAFIKAWSGEKAPTKAEKPTDVRLFRPGEITITKDRESFGGKVTLYIAYLGCVFARVSWGCAYGIDQTSQDPMLTAEQHNELIDNLARFIVQRLTEGVK